MHDKVLAGILRPGNGLIITDLKQVIFLMAFLIHLVSTFSLSFKFYPDIVNVFSKILFVSKMMHLTLFLKNSDFYFLAMFLVKNV